MIVLVFIALIPAAWWLGGVALAWTVALLRPEMMRSGNCTHCGYDRRGVNGQAPCPECGLTVDEAGRRIPRLPGWGACLPAIGTTLIVPGIGGVWLSASMLSGLVGPPWSALVVGVGVFGVVALLLAASASVFVWAQIAEFRFRARLDAQLAWSFLIGAAACGVVGVVALLTGVSLTEGDAPSWSWMTVAGAIGAVAGLGLGPAVMCVGVLTARWRRAVRDAGERAGPGAGPEIGAGDRPGAGPRAGPLG